MRVAAHWKGFLMRAALSLLLAVGFALPVAAPAAAGSADTVTFGGGGWGHSVGMSQYGALGQAREDSSRTGAEIAAHYYTGSSVEPISTTLPSDHFLLDGEGLWVGLLQDRTSFTFIPGGGKVELCQDGDGEGCPRTITPKDGETWKLVRSGNSCQFRRNGTAQGPAGSCSATITWDANTNVRLPDWKDRSVGHGSLQIRPVSGGFHVALSIALDDYVEGIAEVPTSWNAAALDAQAIASRSFAAVKAQQRENGPPAANGDPGLSSKWQDICWCHIRYTTDQVWVGYSREQTPNWAAAAQRTTGMVLTHPDSAFTKNGIVEAFFSSSTAGVTESNRFGFGSSVQYPYLVPVDDHWSADPTLNPNANWEVTVTVATVIERLRTTSKPWQVDFDELTAVSLVNGPPDSTVRFTGKVGSKTVSVDASGSWFRGFGLKSAQITSISTTLDGTTTPPGAVAVAGFRVDDGPTHDGTGNDSKGNNDGTAQCGETIELYVTARNEGDSTLTSLSAKLTESDPYVSIMYNTSANYPNIAAGKTAENPKDWDLKISGNAPDGHKAKLTFTYTAANGGPWKIPVELPISCGDTPEPESGGAVAVAGFRVDDGPTHDGTGNDSKGNNDGTAQCGETIELYVTARNEGDSTLTSLSAKLTESDPYVSIMYNTSANYPNIAAGKTAENPKDWDLKISGNAPDGHKAKLTFTYTAANGGPWKIPVELPISCGDTPEPESGGAVAVAGFRVDDGPTHDGTGNDSKGNNDGTAQCGETIELYVTARNEGDSTLTSLSAKLTESDPYVSIMYNTSANYPNIAAGKTAENPKDWDLKISGNAPDGHKAKLTFTYTAANGGPWKIPVELPISCGNEPAPDPEPTPDPGSPIAISGFRVDDDRRYDSRGNGDGAAQCGETIELYITARNGGSSTLTGVTARLVKTDPYITLLYNAGSGFPDIGSARSQTSHRDWELAIAANAPDGHEAALTFNFTADGGGSWPVTIKLPVGCG